MLQIGAPKGSKEHLIRKGTLLQLGMTETQYNEIAAEVYEIALSNVGEYVKTMIKDVEANNFDVQKVIKNLYQMNDLIENAYKTVEAEEDEVED